ncbi:Pyridoxine 4-dehydrogenase [Myotisia sp. PD_48]|nr:Pyridoxine 4-dehydrogenase [Myotisia sp. PD_48]
MPELLGKKVGPVGYGLMSLTWTPTPPSYEESIRVMKIALEQGANLWNGGEIYGPPEANSLQLLNAYFTRYPEDADKVVLSIKGAKGEVGYVGTEDGVRASVENCVRILDGKKKIDIFECARVDPNIPIEETMKFLLKLRDEGLIGGIGLSEPSASTIRRAAKVAPIASVEIELSLWSTEPMTNGILEACGELNIPVTAYSPLNKGFLTGQLRSFDDIPEGDFRRFFPRFQPDVFDLNLKLVDELDHIAKRKGVPLAQVAISWVQQQGKEFNCTIIPIPGSTKEQRIIENSHVVTLTDSELADIKGLLDKVTVAGERYPAAILAECEG